MSNEQLVILWKDRRSVTESTPFRELVAAIEEGRIAPGTMLTSQLFAQVGVSGLLNDQELVVLIDFGLVEEAGGALKVAAAGTACIVHLFTCLRDSGR